MPSHIEYRLMFTVEADRELRAMQPERREEFEKQLETVRLSPYHPASKATGTDVTCRRAYLRPSVFVEYLISQARIVVVSLQDLEEPLVEGNTAVLDHIERDVRSEVAVEDVLEVIDEGRAERDRIEASGENVADEPDAWQPEKTPERRLSDLEAWAYRVEKLLGRLR